MKSNLLIICLFTLISCKSQPAITQEQKDTFATTAKDTFERIPECTRWIIGCPKTLLVPSIANPLPRKPNLKTDALARRLCRVPLIRVGCADKSNMSSMGKQFVEFHHSWPSQRPAAELEYTDTSATKRARYEYRLVAADDAGLKSSSQIVKISPRWIIGCPKTLLVPILPIYYH